ncbi:MAG: epoxyqueuosine reductase QueH [Oscillospiraceae bacterium]|nr:epoxyqueuosine reductase QueH [Oscillospiraceae bacterium]
MASSIKPNLLLHCCCAPCACYVIEQLCDEYKVSLLFYNPNIEPLSEYEKRKYEIIRLLEKVSYSTEIDLLNCEYENAVFSDAVSSLRDQPERGIRCDICFGLRLEETARRAKDEKFDIFTTTLSVSPLKNATLLNEIGHRAAEKYDVKYLEANFKKRDGYKHSIELSKKLGLYRQNYCGCSSSCHITI